MRILVLAVVLTSLASVRAVTRNQDPCTRAAVLRADSVWQDALLSRDVDAIARSYDPDAATAGSAMPRAKGLEAVKGMWTRLLSDPGFRLTWEARSAEVLEGCDIAYSNGRGRMQNAQRDTSGIYMAVWRKTQSGEWRVLIDGAWY